MRRLCCALVFRNDCTAQWLNDLIRIWHSCNIYYSRLVNINVNRSAGFYNIPGQLTLPILPLHHRLTVSLTPALKLKIPNKCKPETSAVYKIEDNLMKENYSPLSVLTILPMLHKYVVNDCICTLLIYFRKYYAPPINRSSQRLPNMFT